MEIPEVNPYTKCIQPKRQKPITWLSEDGRTNANEARFDIGINANADINTIMASSLDASGVAVNFGNGSDPDLPKYAIIENVFLKNASTDITISPYNFSIFRSDGATDDDLDNTQQDPSKRLIKISGVADSGLSDVDVIVRYFTFNLGTDENTLIVNNLNISGSAANLGNGIDNDLPINAIIENVIVKDSSTDILIDPYYYSTFRSSGSIDDNIDLVGQDPSKRRIKVSGIADSSLGNVDVIVRYFTFV